MKKISYILAVCFVLSLILIPTVSADVSALCINEVCVSASKTAAIYLDADGDASDFVEIYNCGNESIDISGFGLSDSKTPLKWQFPENTVVPANGYLVIFCSSKGSIGTMYKNEYHSNFSIKLGESVTLANRDNSIIDRVTPPSINKDTSWSRIPDGKNGTWANANCTPNATNNGSLITAVPEFSYTSGFYDEPISVSISHPLGYDVYYTTDFSEPTTASTKFTAPISVTDRSSEPNTYSIAAMDLTTRTKSERDVWMNFIQNADVNKCTIIRAAAYDPVTGEMGETVTATYFVGIDRAAEYGDYPILSICDPNFFDEGTGLYTDNEIPANMTYFDGNGNFAFEQNCGFKRRGNIGSRGSLQSNMNIYARSEYGKNEFNYPMIPNAKANGTGKEIKKFKRLMIRGGNNTNGLKYVDPVVQNLGKTEHLTSQNWTWCSVFINGEYWGSYSLQENLHEKNISNHFGVDDDDIMFYKLGNYDANADRWGADINWALSDNYSYEEFCRRFDVDSFIDYYVAYACGANSDWPQNNISAWRSFEDKADETGNPYYDGRWRFNLWDFDMAYQLMQSDYFGGLIGESKNYGFDRVWSWNVYKKLLETPEFKTKFVQKMENGFSILYNPNNLRNKFWKEYQKALPLLNGYASRYPDFSGYNALELCTRSALWMNKLEEDMKDYFGFDPAVDVSFQINDHKAGKVYVYGTDTDIPKHGETKGRYFKEYPLEINAVAEDGFTFSHWYVSGGGSIDNMNSPTANITLTDDTVITAVFTEN